MAVTSTAVNDLGGPVQLPLLYSRVWQVSAVVAPAAVLTQSNGTDTVTVPGVALGDIVLAKSFATAGSEALVSVTAYVSAANTVTLLYANNTAGTITIGTGVVKLLIVRSTF